MKSVDSAKLLVVSIASGLGAVATLEFKIEYELIRRKARINISLRLRKFVTNILSPQLFWLISLVGILLYITGKFE